MEGMKLKGECDDDGKDRKVVGGRYEQSTLHEFMKSSNIFKKEKKSLVLVTRSQIDKTLTSQRFLEQSVF